MKNTDLHINILLLKRLTEILVKFVTINIKLLCGYSAPNKGTMILI